MGHYTSKLFYNDNHDVKKDAESKRLFSFNQSQCTPILCKKKLQVDPRSISIGIPRTPIEINYSPNTSNRSNIISKYEMKNPILNTDLEINTLKINENYTTLNSTIPKTPLINDFLESNILNIHDANQFDLSVLNSMQFDIRRLDPRSPASDFERTPILKIKSTELVSSKNLLKYKNNLNLDVCIKLSTSPLKISESQKLPDFIISVNKICGVEEEVDNLDLSLSSDDSIRKSNLLSKSIIALSSEEIDTSLTDNLMSKTNKNLETTKYLTQHTLSHNNCIENFEVLKNTSMSIEYVNQPLVIEQNFNIWKDSYSTESNSDNISVFKSNSFEKNFKISEKEDRIALNNYNVKKSQNKNVKNRLAKNKEIKQEDIENKKKINKQNKFSPHYKHISELSKNRTPLSNRSNNNG